MLKIRNSEESRLHFQHFCSVSQQEQCGDDGRESLNRCGLRAMGTKLVHKFLCNIQDFERKGSLSIRNEHGLDLVSIIPPMIVGLFICPKMQGSTCAILAPIFESKDDYSLLINVAMVHIANLARAYIYLLEHPEAKGR
ncbi:hypothetical protein HRI_002240500 [Hibiscus trionum]|uniref:Uncharacterized protein n=1 Tax=Hibiscus trionum TaxID=183268 RepID=A0A9W7M176_HIBTR|nr:hypothetical protein HRI_002240500 [Hibiscus trionum]